MTLAHQLHSQSERQKGRWQRKDKCDVEGREEEEGKLHTAEVSEGEAVPRIISNMNNPHRVIEY